MQISLKEAYESIRRVIPKDWKVDLSVKYDPDITSWHPSGIMWSLNASKDDAYCFESQEIFSIALGNLATKVANVNAKPVEDVVVDNKTEEEEKPSSDIPF